MLDWQEMFDDICDIMNQMTAHTTSSSIGHAVLVRGLHRSKIFACLNVKGPRTKLTANRSPGHIENVLLNEVREAGETCASFKLTNAIIACGPNVQLGQGATPQELTPSWITLRRVSREAPVCIP